MSKVTNIDELISDMKKNGIGDLEDESPVEDSKLIQRVGYYYRTVEPTAKGAKIKESPQYKLMAKEVFAKKDMAFDDSQSLRFDGKKWRFMSKTELSNFIIKQNSECIMPQHMDMFAKIIRGTCHTEAIGFIPNDGLINVSNGVVHIMTGALGAHDYKYNFKYVSPVVYDEQAKCPTWDKFLEDTFGGNQELIDLSKRLFGYLLMGGRPFLHRAFVLYGTGRNGKSTFVDILRAVLGSDSYSTVSMAKLDREFSVVAIDGKLANIVEETPTDEINAEAFKNLVGGGEVQASYKGLDEFKFRCNARFVFACNDMPVFKDKSVGLEERLVFIPFKRFLKEDARDEMMLEKLLAELPGIFNWAINGAQVMAVEKKIPKYDAVIEAKEMYRQETDPLYAWFTEEVQVSTSGGRFTPQEIYEKYKSACELNGNKAYSKDKFMKRFRILVATKSEELKLEYDASLRDETGKHRVLDHLRFLTAPPAPRIKLSGVKPMLDF